MPDEAGQASSCPMSGQRHSNCWGGSTTRALRQGPVANVALAAVMGWPNDLCRAERVAATVVADGLAQLTEGRYRLPG